MDFISKLKTRIEQVRATVGEAVDAVIVPESVKEERLSICNTCDFLFEPTMQCKKCGCFLKAKTSFAFFKCPIDKWHESPPDEQND